MQDSIIVYRNPMEKMFWENAGTILPLAFVFGATMLVSFIIFHFLLQLVFGKNKNYVAETAIFLSSVAAGILTYRLA